MKGQAGTAILRRRLTGQDPGDARLPRLLDAVADADGRVRLFFGQGSAVQAVAPDGGPGCVLPEELREISGGLMVAARGAGALALRDAGPFAFSATDAETGLFAGLNTALAFRLEEPVAEVATWLTYHAETHGLQAALIVNRLPTDAAFVADLALALGPTDLQIVVL
ncbi:MAG: hypothetical protein ACRC6I_14960, partial [Paracoccaceae bacterium]